jgi:hypothetical protein
MREISLHILDAAENSISAGSDYLRIAIEESIRFDMLYIHIVDNGKGMGADVLESAHNPFFTTKPNKMYGLGLSLFKVSAEHCMGSFLMKSKEGVGTEIEAIYRHSHMDRMPLGNVEDTIASIIIAKPDINLVYTHSYEDKKFSFETRDIKNILGGVSISDPSILSWLREFIRGNIAALKSD